MSRSFESDLSCSGVADDCVLFGNDFVCAHNQIPFNKSFSDCSQAENARSSGDSITKILVCQSFFDF
jgi:hypothetical protein